MVLCNAGVKITCEQILRDHSMTLERVVASDKYCRYNGDTMDFSVCMNCINIVYIITFF